MVGPICLLLLSATSLFHSQPVNSKSLPLARAGGHGLDVSVGGARRLRRDLRDLLPYEAQMMSYPVAQGGDNDLYYQPDEWRRRGLDQALQRLVESDQRREQQQEEEQEAAYLGSLLRLLNEAENAGLVGPGDADVVEEEEEEEDEQVPGDFQGLAPADYDETVRGMSMGKPQAAWWALLEPQLAPALLQRLEPQLAQALLERARQDRLQQVSGLAQRPGAGSGLSQRPGTGSGLAQRPGAGSGLAQRPGVALSAGSELSRGTDQETLKYLVAKILSSIGPSNSQMTSSSHRARRDLSITAGGGGARAVSPTHRRTRRSLDDLAPPLPSSDPPLLRVKRLEEEEEEEEEEERYTPRQAAGLQRMKRIDTMATAPAEELNHGSRRRRRRAAENYDPRILAQHILQYLQE